MDRTSKINKVSKMVYFVVGSQDLYGENVLKLVDKNSKVIAEFLDNNNKYCSIKYIGTAKNETQITNICSDINNDKDCIGVIFWMHTFSPSKMWINGLKILNKPILHLHTQINEKLPYSSIDMDYMNANQSAHGDREFGYILTRLNINRKVVVGYYKDIGVINDINNWSRLARMVSMSKSTKICRFGDNMRSVAVTEGDKVEAAIKFGWQVDYYGIGDLVEVINSLDNEDVNQLLDEYKKEYAYDKKDIDTIIEQVKYELAIEYFLNKNGYSGFTTNFEDLHGLKQLPGLAVQRLMAKGYGFGGEGDWKTSALCAILCRLAKGESGATGFMEDYTYDLTNGREIVLGAHMLEVSEAFSVSQPRIVVSHLGIGGKDSPARLVFDTCDGDGVSISMVDMGDRFRLIVAKIKLIKSKESTPNLPVAHLSWQVLPNFNTGVKAWILAGGAHHTVVSTQYTIDDICDLGKFLDIEVVVIDENTTINAFERDLKINNFIWSKK